MLPSLGIGTEARVRGSDALRHHQHVGVATCQALVVPMDHWRSMCLGGWDWVDSWVAKFSLEFAQDAWGEIERCYVL